MAICTIFSRGDAILRGLSSVFPGLGIYAVLLALNLYLPALSSALVFLIHSSVIPSRVSLVIAAVILPGLLLMAS